MWYRANKVEAKEMWILW